MMMIKTLTALNMTKRNEDHYAMFWRDIYGRACFIEQVCKIVEARIQIGDLKIHLNRNLISEAIAEEIDDWFMTQTPGLGNPHDPETIAMRIKIAVAD